MGKRLHRLQRVRSAGHLRSKFAKQALPSAMQCGVGVHGAPPPFPPAAPPAGQAAAEQQGKHNSQKCLAACDPCPQVSVSVPFTSPPPQLVALSRP